MGVESYFITFIPEEVKPNNSNGTIEFFGTSKIHISYVLECLKKQEFNICQIKESDWCWYLINDSLVMRIEHQNMNVQAISLEGCFSWYKEGLHLCYDIASFINSEIFSIKVYHPLGIMNELMSREEFIEHLLTINNKKYGEFIKLFGELKFKTSPEDFYKVYMKNKKKDKLFRIFKFLGSKR